MIYLYTVFDYVSQEIELVITRLEEETTASREELERAAEARVRRVREKYETELREVERSERSTLEKFNDLKVCLLRGICMLSQSSTHNMVLINCCDLSGYVVMPMFSY